MEWKEPEWDEAQWEDPEFVERSGLRRGVWHGLQVIWGPTGSGKSVLVTAIIYLHISRPEYRCLGRSCGDKSCREEWEVYTNSTKLKGPKWERNGKSVVHDIEDVIPEIMAKKDIGHALFYIEELQEWWDSRRSSSKGNVELSYVAAQLRKAKCKAYGTTPNLNLIDKRGREIAKRATRVYNPDQEAINVGGQMREMSVGHLHPDELDALEDEEWMFFTKPYRDLYDTHERFNRPNFFNPRGRVNTVQVVESGRGKTKKVSRQVVPTTYSDLVDKMTIWDLIINDGVYRISPAELCDQVLARHNVRLTEAKLDLIMADLGYATDDEGRYEVGIDPEAVLEGVA